MLKIPKEDMDNILGRRGIGLKGVGVILKHFKKHTTYRLKLVKLFT